MEVVSQPVAEGLTSDRPLAQSPPRSSRETSGIFVTFEGCEGAGKTTQAEMLKDYLLMHGHDVVVTREPGGTQVGEKIRDILLNSGGQEISPVTEALLFAANRAQGVKDVIKPALEKGWIVIADRFVDSSLAYQGVGRGLGLEAVNNLNEWATGGLEPHLTVYLDIPYSESIARKSHEIPDRIEQEPRQFHENVRQAYNLLSRICPQRMLVIDATDAPDAIHARVVSSVTKLLAA
jgi:dTMP kinase